MILVDTGPLVALCDARDSKHRLAARHLASFEGESLVVCDAVLTEACFHLPFVNQRQRLRLLLHDLGVEAHPLSGSQDLWQEVLNWLVKYADHEPDWTDGYLSIVAGRDRSVKVWTYDREFRTTWRRPDGSMIPLAVSRI